MKSVDKKLPPKYALLPKCALPLVLAIIELLQAGNYGRRFGRGTGGDGQAPFFANKPEQRTEKAAFVFSHNFPEVPVEEFLLL